jgi:hypothetical protein
MAITCPISNHDVTPAKAGAHPEMPAQGQTSGWIPAFAGMTPSGRVEQFI